MLLYDRHWERHWRGLTSGLMCFSGFLSRSMWVIAKHYEVASSLCETPLCAKWCPGLWQRPDTISLWPQQTLFLLWSFDYSLWPQGVCGWFVPLAYSFLFSCHNFQCRELTEFWTLAESYWFPIQCLSQTRSHPLWYPLYGTQIVSLLEPDKHVPDF